MSTSTGDLLWARDFSIGWWEDVCGRLCVRSYKETGHRFGVRYAQRWEEPKRFQRDCGTTDVFFFLVPRYKVAFCCRSIELLCLRLCLIFPSLWNSRRKCPEKKVSLWPEQTLHTELTASAVLSCPSKPIGAAVSAVCCSQQITAEGKWKKMMIKIEHKSERSSQILENKN